MNLHATREAMGMEHILHELKHLLPAQAPLKDFVHHNTLHAFQHLPFFQGLKQASEQFGYKGFLSLAEYRKLYREGKIKGLVLKKIVEDQFGDQANTWLVKLLDESQESFPSPKIGQFRSHWRNEIHFNLDKKIHPFLFRLLSAYLDQGISIWPFPLESKGFLDSIRQLQLGSYSSIFTSSRVVGLLQKPDLNLEELLELLVGDSKGYGWYVFDQQFAHPGWSGMVSILEDQPESLLDSKHISLKDLILVECLLEIDALDKKFGKSWVPLGQQFPHDTHYLFEVGLVEEFDFVRQCWQEAYEWSYYDEVLAGIQAVVPTNSTDTVPSFQALFCIDDRECSTRRHLEFVDPACATFGTPGFFNVEFYFQPEYGKFHTKSCPAPVTPKFLIKETAKHKKLASDVHFHQNNHSLVRGWLSSQTLGFWSALKLVGNILRPSSSALEVSSFHHMDPKGSLSILYQGEEENGLQVGFTVEEMVDRIEGLLRSIGLLEGFSPLVYLIGHGASSINNTHYAGYDCGACCGRPGSVNARVAAFMANQPEVRIQLKARGIDIPAATQFLGGLHDTTKDELLFYDEDILHSENQKLHRENQEKFVRVLDINSLERSRRFDTLDKNKSISGLHEAVKKRAFSLFEPRPEYNHATNALCIVSRKSTLKGLFFDRRAFLNSYDYRTDPAGKALIKILSAAIPVCGGINLEYYFSRMDPDKLGAGTKLPHNVMGLIGVANGADGDLRTGLPYQMVEIHDPIRLLLVVEQVPQLVNKVITSSPALLEWVNNNWVHLVVLDPHSGKFLRWKDEKFVAYDPLTTVEHLDHLQDKLLSTQQNLPVYLIDSL
uniref:YbcC family protein n=1 Tax=Algoriphagus sp. TaxID=1872435 RepID=UPI00404839A1